MAQGRPPARSALAALRSAVQALDDEGLLSRAAVGLITAATLGRLRREQDQARQARFRARLFPPENNR